MKHIKTLFLLFAILSLSMISCSDDNGNGDDEVEYKQPTIAERDVVVEVPECLQELSDNGDINASIAISYMSLANAIAGFAQNFAIPQDVQPNMMDGDAVYSWTYGGYSYWMTFDDEGDTYTWEYDYQMPDTERFTYIRATESKDGNSGTWSIYDPDSPGNAVWTYTWSFDSNDNFSATLVFDDNSDDDGQYVVNSNADGSGDFMYSSGDQTEAEVNWNADGSGNYWLYNNGDPVENTWDAC